MARQRQTPATPALPATPVTPTLPVTPAAPNDVVTPTLPVTPTDTVTPTDVVTPADTVTPVEPEVTKGKPIKVRHKKTGSEHEVSYDYYQRNKSVLECL